MIKSDQVTLTSRKRWQPDYSSEDFLLHLICPPQSLSDLFTGYAFHSIFAINLVSVSYEGTNVKPQQIPGG